MYLHANLNRSSRLALEFKHSFGVKALFADLRSRCGVHTQKDEIMKVRKQNECIDNRRWIKRDDMPRMRRKKEGIGPSIVVLQRDAPETKCLELPCN